MRKEDLLEQELNYGFYSKMLNKPFDTLEELQEAEAKQLEAEAEKKKLSDARKADADKVEEAFKAMKSANAAGYVKLTELRQKLRQEEKAVYKEMQEAENKYKAALREFVDKHPEGYHLTLKDGFTEELDISQTVSSLLNSMLDIDWF